MPDEYKPLAALEYWIWEFYDVTCTHAILEVKSVTPAVAKWSLSVMIILPNTLAKELQVCTEH